MILKIGLSISQLLPAHVALPDAFSVTLEGHAQPVYATQFFSNGRRLVSSGFDGRTRFWDLTLTTELFSLPTGKMISQGFSSDERRLVVGGLDGKMFTFDSGITEASGR